MPCLKGEQQVAKKGGEGRLSCSLVDRRGGGKFSARLRKEQIIDFNLRKRERGRRKKRAYVSFSRRMKTKKKKKKEKNPHHRAGGGVPPPRPSSIPVVEERGKPRFL